MARTGTSAQHVDKYVATVRDCLRATLQEAQAQFMAEGQRQKWYYDQKIGTTGSKPGNLILVKAVTFQGKRKIKDRWEDKPHEVVHQIMTDIPLYEVKDQNGHSCILHCNWLLLIASEAGIPLCVGVCQAWDGCTSPIPVRPTPRGSDSKTTPQGDNGLVITQHQARKTFLGWIKGSYGFSWGCWLEHPVKMGEDFKWCAEDMGIHFDGMASRIMCIWWRDGCQSIDASR